MSTFPVTGTLGGSDARACSSRCACLEKAADGYRWKLTEAPVPPLGDHKVLIRVRAGAASPELDKALGANAEGVLADFVVLEDTTVASAPAGLSYEEASTLPTAGLTGWMASVGRRAPHKGDVVLIQGTGGVSVFAMQFAAAAGARIILTSSSDDKLKRAQAIAPHDGINYKSVPDWGRRVFQLTNGHGADVVVDVGGKSTLEQSVRSLAFGGTLSIVGGLTGYDGQIGAGALLGKSANVQGIFVGSRADFLRMSAFITAHHLHPVIDRTFPFEQFEAALEHMSDGDFVGKIVLTLNRQSGP